MCVELLEKDEAEWRGIQLLTAHVIFDVTNCAITPTGQSDLKKNYREFLAVSHCITSLSCDIVLMTVLVQIEAVLMIWWQDQKGTLMHRWAITSPEYTFPNSMILMIMFADWWWFKTQKTAAHTLPTSVLHFPSINTPQSILHKNGRVSIDMEMPYIETRICNPYKPSIDRLG